MTVVGVVCPKCGDFTTEPVEHPHNQPAFRCNKCKAIVEPPGGLTFFGSPGFSPGSTTK